LHKDDPSAGASTPSDPSAGAKNRRIQLIFCFLFLCFVLFCFVTQLFVFV
jgi:hypothetical protein